MIILKYVTGLTALLLFNTFSIAQPSQTVILNYIKSKTLVLYLADDKKPDSIKEIKPGRIETGNAIFGKTSNNRMDVSAVFLRDLLSLNNGDIQFQQKVYEALQKSDFPILLLFINDVATNLDAKFIEENGIHHYNKSGRQYIIPATYRAPELNPTLGKRWAFVFGEQYNKEPMLMKEVFIDLFSNVNRGKLGQVSQTILQSQDAVVNILKTDKDIPQITSAQQTRWMLADTKQLGIIGNDWDGPDEIGIAPAERKMNLGLANPQFLNFWFPNIRAQDNNKAWKRTLIGKMKEEAEHYENNFVFPDHDIDFYVIPDKDYQYLIDENPKPNVSFFSGAGNIINDHERPNCPTVHDHVEGEIDLADINEKQFVNFFNEEMKTAKNAGFYGTWMYDRGHCDHPEIHPAEQIWWSKRSTDVFTYRCNLVCDYSDRYNRDNQYDSDNGKLSVKPWARPPIKGVFAISFMVKPGQRILYRIFQHDNYNVNKSKTVSFDLAKVHHYIINGKKVITVVEPELKCMKVSFEDIAYDRAGNLTGFIVLTSAVGQVVKGDPVPGHLFFEVKRSVLKSTDTPPGKIKISLESIECTGVDDTDDNEEIFGRIRCKAFSVKDTISYRTQQLKISSNTGAVSCNGDIENLFCTSCPDWVTFKKNQKNTYTSSFTYDFPTDGFIEVNGDLDEADSKDCKFKEVLGIPQKTYILTNEIGSTPYKFTQFFASGGTIIKANFSVQRVR